MQNWARYSKILDLFISENVTIMEFLSGLLQSSKDYEPLYPALIGDLLGNAHLLVGKISVHERAMGPVRDWAHNYACGIYAHEVQHLSRVESGLHFNALRAEPYKITQFSMDSLASIMRAGAPYIWNLVSRFSVGSEEPMGRDSQEGRLTAQTVKSVSLISQILHATDQKCNLMASIIGVFLHTCNVPERVIDALCRMNMSISTSSIDNAIKSLSREAEKDVRAAGQTLLYGYVIDNFDIQERHKTTTVEQPGSSMVHLISGTLIKLAHTKLSDLKFSSFLWERSRAYNDRSTIQLPRHTIRDLFTLHKDTIDTHGLNQRQQFIAWMFLRTLCLHGPEYFRQFLSMINDPDAVDKIPCVKTAQEPARSMHYSNSTVEGNIKAMEDILKQGGVYYTEYLQVIDGEEYIIMVHGDLGTGERLHTARIRRSIESTSRQRMQYIIFIPGLFHTKMACADAIWRIFIRPVQERNDESSFFSFVKILYPKDSSKIAGNKASFQILDDCIVRVGNADRLECWRECAWNIWPGCDTLDKFAERQPQFQDLITMSQKLAREYSSAGIKHEELRNQPLSERDTQYENTLFRIDYFLLYEELAYSMRTGDVGRIETCLRRWIPIFRGCGKHKYAKMLLDFLLDVHFLYPPDLRKSVRYNWLCNPKGSETGFRGVDWLLELNNLLTKVIYGGRSSNYTVHRIIQESVLIELYRKCKAVIEKQLLITPKTMRHGEPDMTETYAALSDAAVKSSLLRCMPGRASAQPISDVFSDGLAKLSGESLLDSNDREPDGEDSQVDYEIIATEEDIEAEFE